MKDEVLFKTIERPVMPEVGYQYAYGLEKESFFENEYYVPYSGDMRLSDSIFARGAVINNSYCREVEYEKAELPSKVCTMLEDKMGSCSERLNDGEVVYITLSYSILDGEEDEVVLPNGTVERRKLVPGNYREVYCFVPNKLFSKDTVHKIEELSILVPDSLDIDRVGRDRIFEGGFNLTYPVKIKLKDEKEYCVSATNVLYRGDDKDFLNTFLKKHINNTDFTNDELLARMSEYYANKDNMDFGDFETWNNLKDWNNPKDLNNRQKK